MSSFKFKSSLVDKDGRESNKSKRLAFTAAVFPLDSSFFFFNQLYSVWCNTLSFSLDSGSKNKTTSADRVVVRKKGASPFLHQSAVTLSLTVLYKSISSNSLGAGLSAVESSQANICSPGSLHFDCSRSCQTSSSDVY